jgi:hypothetical protein
MAIKASPFTKWTITAITGDCSGDVITNDYYVDLVAGDIVLNDIIDIGILPANHTVVDMVLIPDDLDTNGAPTLALDVGIMSGTPGDTLTARTCGNEFFAADTSVRTGVVATMSKKAGFLVQPSAADRSIGVKFQAAAATAAAGRIRLRVLMAPASPEIQF